MDYRRTGLLKLMDKTACCGRGDSGEKKCRRGTQQTGNKLVYIIQHSNDFC